MNPSKSPKKALIVSEELIRKIDESRGDLSREEFLSFLIDNFLRSLSEEEEEKGKRCVTRDEFEEFRRRLSDFLTTFVDFFLGYGVKETEEVKKEKVKGLLKERLEEFES